MPHTEPLRILHADDDESFTLLVRHSVRADPALSSRCDIRFVTDGSVAVDYVMGRGEYADRVKNPFPHLILLDQRMRTMDGAEALAAIKTHPLGLRTPVCILSTSAQPSLVEACYKLGGAFCVEKPLDYSELGPRLKLLITFAIEVLGLTRLPR